MAPDRGNDHLRPGPARKAFIEAGRCSSHAAIPPVRPTSRSGAPWSSMSSRAAGDRERLGLFPDHGLPACFRFHDDLGRSPAWCRSLQEACHFERLLRSLMKRWPMVSSPLWIPSISNGTTSCAEEAEDRMQGSAPSAGTPVAPAHGLGPGELADHVRHYLGDHIRRSARPGRSIMGDVEGALLVFPLLALIHG